MKSGMLPISIGRRETWILPVVIFVAAFLVRFLAAAAIPSVSAHSNDALAYRDLGSNLVHRHAYVTVIDAPHSLEARYAARPPLMPLALALVYRVFGESPASEHLLLGVLGALACVAVYWLGRELFGGRAALAAAVIAAIYPFFLVLSAVPLTESCNVLLYPLFVLTLIRFGQRRRWQDAMLAGAILGMSALSKAVILGFYPIVLLAVGLGAPREAWWALARGWALMGLAASLVVVPWTVRNYLAMGAVIPVNLQFGSVFFQGSGPAAEYSISHLERGLTNGWAYAPNFGDLYPKEADPVASDRAAARAAAAYIRQHPAAFLNLAWRKERIFWGSYTHLAHRASWSLVALFAVWGLVLTRRRWRELLTLYLLMAYTALVPVFFTSMPRFRAPIEPLLIVFAGAALVWGLDLATLLGCRVSGVGCRPDRDTAGRTLSVLSPDTRRPTPDTREGSQGHTATRSGEAAL